MQPGDVIQPDTSPTVPPPNDPPQEPDAPEGPVVNDAEASFYKGDSDSQSAPVAQHSEDGAITSWTASEYALHEKTILWYLALVGILALFGAAVYALTKDLVTVVVLLFVGLAFGYYASRKPKTLHYQIGENGIVIQNRFYSFGDFKSFAAHHDGMIGAVVLLPMKRFMPALSIYYPPDQEDVILSTIADVLPFEEKEPDLVDKFMAKIRF